MNVFEFARRHSVNPMEVYLWISSGMPAFKDQYESRWYIPFNEARRWLVKKLGNGPIEGRALFI
ncbi:MAG: hypothetical protein WBD99_06490 [Thermodesulfobacteriota bacterium]